MDNQIKGKLLKTAGWITVGIGVYLVHKGVVISNTIEAKDGIIDAVFEVIEE